MLTRFFTQITSSNLSRCFLGMACSSHSVCHGSAEAADMSEMMMEEFRQNVVLHERPEMIRRRTWWENTCTSTTYLKSVDQMPTVDEDIIPDGLLEDYDIRELIEEADAVPGGRWESYVRSKYQHENEGITASPTVRFSKNLRHQMAEYGDTTLDQKNFGVMLKRGMPLVFNDSSSGDEYFDQSSSGDENSIGVDDMGNPTYPGELQIHFESRENGLPTASEDDSDDSDDNDGEDALQAEAETMRIARIFEDFPTMAKPLGPVDSLNEEYGVLAVAQDSQWKCLDSSKLSPRVRTWLAQFTSE